MRLDCWVSIIPMPIMLPPYWMATSSFAVAMPKTEFRICFLSGKRSGRCSRTWMLRMIGYGNLTHCWETRRLFH